LQQLVAPIALYPDELVAQILAGATYPTQIVEADRWLHLHPDMKADALAQAVDSQSWDASVKALTQFPGLLGMLDTNLSWTSALGEAYLNGEQPLLDAIQVMRQRAQQAGNLHSTQQENVDTQNDAISIEPTDTDVVYIPEYDPWTIYGDPLDPYDDWSWIPGFYFNGLGIGFGLGIDIGLYGGFGWGWYHWHADWRGHDLRYGDHRYVSHTRDFNHGNGFAEERAGIDRTTGFARIAAVGHASGIGALDERIPSGMHSGAFSGFSHGGEVGGFSDRGRASFGGFHGGGGGHR
jgi:hypothetical protein